MKQFRNLGEIKSAARNGDPDALYLLGVDALKKGNNRDALDALMRSANLGNALAMVEMGKLKMTQFGGFDMNGANEWFSKAEETDSAEVHQALAKAFFFGDYVEADYVRAKMHFERLKKQGNGDIDSYLSFIDKYGDLLKPAEYGDSQSLLELAELFITDVFGFDRKDIGVKWLEKAAKTGCSQAMRKLGDFYEEGVVVDRNLYAARKWYRSAADRGEEGLNTVLAELNSLCPIAFDDSYGLIYKNILYYGFSSEVSAICLRGNVSKLELSLIQELHYQPEKHKCIVKKQNEDIAFSFKYEEAAGPKDTREGNNFLNQLVMRQGFRFVRKERPMTILVDYAAIFFTFVFKGLLGSIIGVDVRGVDSIGLSTVHVYSK